MNLGDRMVMRQAVKMLEQIRDEHLNIDGSGEDADVVASVEAVIGTLKERIAMGVE